MKKISLIIGAIVIAVFMGAMCSTTDTNQNENQNLNKNVNQEAEAVNEAASTDETAVEEDARILIEATEENLQYNPNNPPDCEADFIVEPADQTIAYTNQEKGISFELPYNNSWGTDQYRMNPYDEVGDTVYFGSLGGFEGCSWMRGYMLNYLAPKSAEEVITEYTFPDVQEPEKMEINGLTVIKVRDLGLCDNTKYIIVGDLNNFEFTPLCGEANDFIEGIIETVQLTK